MLFSALDDTYGRPACSVRQNKTKQRLTRTRRGGFWHRSFMNVTWEILMHLMSTVDSWPRALAPGSPHFWGLVRETLLPLISEE